MMLDKTILGLTGPSGAGKGTVGAAFFSRGARVIDCDKVARQVVEKGKPALAEIIDTFGTSVLNEDGTLCRPKLAEIVFHDKDALHKLNRITHKYISKEIEIEIATCQESVVVIDAPTLFESGINAICHKIICVLAEKETRIKRIMVRDGLSREKAEERIFAQPDDDFYRSQSDFVVENNEDTDKLDTAVSTILHEVFI